MVHYWNAFVNSYVKNAHLERSVTMDGVIYHIDTYRVIPDNVETEHFLAHILLDGL